MIIVFTNFEAKNADNWNMVLNHKASALYQKENGYWSLSCHDDLAGWRDESIPKNWIVA